MRIEFVEIANFRRLRSTRVGFSEENTVFVGANNSGKTSAMVALRYFLVERERRNISLNDFTLSHWPSINSVGDSWEKSKAGDEPLPIPKLDEFLPFVDIWLQVKDDEVHYVQKILPTLDWEGGRLGVRLRFEPKDAEEFQKAFLAIRSDVQKLQNIGKEESKEGVTDGDTEAVDGLSVSLWPENLVDFLRRRVQTFFNVRAYVLDPDKCECPKHGLAQPQTLPEDSDPIDGDPFRGLIRIDEISAQRGFGEAERSNEDDANILSAVPGTRKLSEQLRRYYNRHLDPYENPDAQDLKALKAIEDAQRAFDARLKDGFSKALKEMEKLGYPGVSDPLLNISTRLRPVDGLNHEAAVQYVMQMTQGDSTLDLHLPEDSNGLGYQNLVSMVFRLMSFRDAWMRVGKAQLKVTTADYFIPPLHLVLIEEPEAHLHTQVQQVFIRQAYKILRAHKDLGNKSGLTTQLVVSTHSSHIAHECDFSSLRYFRRMPADEGDIPTSCVINLTDIFGDEDDTKRFVTRYLKVTHCDLFFADAAILIEGPAERILIPHFVQHNAEFCDLLESYITWLEIGGSHAHRLRNLVESLGLTVLIITDLDAMDDKNKTTIPKRGADQKSRNQTLKAWCPGIEELDDLINLPNDDKCKTYAEQLFSVRVAYQCPINVTLKEDTGEALSNTLEDALVFENIEFFAKHDGIGLFKKFKSAISDSESIADLSSKLFNDIKGGGKAELALDLLEIKDPTALAPPTYIREGLLWLAAQLQQRQKELGLPTPIANAASEIDLED